MKLLVYEYFLYMIVLKLKMRGVLPPVALFLIKEREKCNFYSYGFMLRGPLSWCTVSGEVVSIFPLHDSVEVKNAWSYTSSDPVLD
jgi:hypothetical protein